jgi:hypothetical protein
MLLFYIIQIITFSDFCIFPKVYNPTPLYDFIVSDPSVSPTWQVCLPLYEIEKYDFRTNPSGITSVPNFIQISVLVFKLNHMDGWMYKLIGLAL